MDTNLLQLFVAFLDEYYEIWKQGYTIDQDFINRAFKSLGDKGKDVVFLIELSTGYKINEFPSLGNEVLPPPTPFRVDTDTLQAEIVRARLDRCSSQNVKDEDVMCKRQREPKKNSPVMDINEFCDFTSIPKNSIYQPSYREKNNINALMLQGGKGSKYTFIRSKVYERYKL